LTASQQSVSLGRASGIKSLPPFPPAVCQLIQLIDHENVHFREVSRVLELDVALSRQVLRAANLALPGGHESASILHALSAIGVDRLRDIAVTVALRNFIGDVDSALLHRCWRHDLATALWCELFADYFNVDNPLAYTVGILHDIGRIALLLLLRDDYALFLDSASSDDADTLEAERKLCDADHCQVGHYLARAWNFPPFLDDLIAHYHDENIRESPMPRLLVRAACLAASMSGFHTVGVRPEWEPARIEALLPQGAEALRHRSYETLLEQVALRLNHTECSLL
jgi:HD-like signal output (HDOD) protein